jgi:hypothetical protein
VLRKTLSLVVAASLFVIGACADTPSKDDCKKLLDHVIALELKAGGGDAVNKDIAADLEDQKKRVMEYVEKDFLDTCIEDLPKSQLECGLKAKTMSQLFECDKT